MKNDAVTVDPQVHKLVYEEESLRVLDVHVPAGAKVAMHWHPRNILYVLKGGTLRLTSEKGEIKDLVLEDGHVAPLAETSHAVENIGSTDVHAIQIEFKK